MLIVRNLALLVPPLTIGVILPVVLLFVITAAGCSPPKLDTVQRDYPETVAFTSFAEGNVYTLQHDSHKLIVVRTVAGGSAILHHPDCSCFEKAR